MSSLNLTALIATTGISLLVSATATAQVPLGEGADDALAAAREEALRDALGELLPFPLISGNPCLTLAGTIACNQTVTGTLEVGDELLLDNTWVDGWRFDVITPVEIDILLASTEFNTFLILADDQCNTITQNNECTADDNDLSCLSLQLAPGTYYILANSEDEAIGGEYTLEVICSLPCSAGGPYDVQCQGATTDVQLEALGGGLVLAPGDHTIDTDAGTIDGAPWPGFASGVFLFFDLVIQDGATLTATGDNRLILMALDDITIAGTIDASGADGGDGAFGIVGTGGAGGPGGGDGGPGNGVLTGNGIWGAGPGPGRGGTGGSGAAGGGGGGGHAMMGLPGTGNVMNPGGAGGPAYASLPPLEGGSGGGAGGAGDGAFGAGGGGGGGGAVQAVSLTGTVTVTATGVIDAGAGDGGSSTDDNQGGGGGGSGGGIELLGAVMPTSAGTLNVDGGLFGLSGMAGSLGNGGLGRDGRTRLAMIPPETATFLWETTCPDGTFDDETLPNPVLTVDTDPGCLVECEVTVTITTPVPGGQPVETTCSTTVTISDTTDPVIMCPADVTIECTESTDPSNTGSATATDNCSAMAAGVFGPATDFPAGMQPRAVTTGLFDGDAFLDLAVANVLSDTVSVLLGDGAGGFGPATDFPTTGSSPGSLTTGFFDADGLLDLAVANNGGNGISVFLGDGTGGFGPAANFLTANGPVSIAAGRFDGDAFLDLAVASGVTNNVSILLGDGAGGFGFPTNFATGDSPVSVTVGLFNGDAFLDLALANNQGDDVSILLGDGAGGFGPATNFPAGVEPISVTTGLFDGDTFLDLAVANDDDANVSILLGDGAGGFGPATNFAVGDRPFFVTTGLFDGDAFLDLAVSSRLGDAVSILIGDGAGGFGPATDFVVGDAPYGVTAGLFDGDAFLDLAVANLGSDSVSILLNQATFTGTVTSSDVITDGACPHEMTIQRTWTATDACGNTAECVQTIEVVDSTNPVIGCPADVTIECTASTATANTGTATATDNCSVMDAGVLGPVTYFPAGLASVAVTAGHFDGDAHIDLALANANGDDVSVLLGDGVGGFGAPAAFPVGDNPVSVTTGHFNGDANLDLAVVNRNDDNVSVLLGDGLGGFGAVTNFAVGDAPESVTTGFFDADANLDLAVANAGPGVNNVSILLGDGGGGFGAATNFTVGFSPRSVTTGLFNADGNLDLAVANNGTDNVSILLGDGLGGFGAATNFAAGDSPESVIAGHFDADGNLDLAVANRFDDDVSILLGDGLGGFDGPTDFPVGDGPVSVTAGDIDGDGILDLAVANANSLLVSTLLGDGLGGFGAPTDSAPIGNVFSVITGHFNGDANLDLAVAIANGFASIFLNQTTFTGTIVSDDVITGTACPEEYTIARTWTATDECGNVAECVQTITVEDSTMPDITCPANVTIECTESPDPGNTGFATATDNCDIVGPEIGYSDTVTPGPPPCPQLATIARLWTATDCAGNQRSCTQTITVVDTTVPQIFCPADTTIECDESTLPTNTGMATANPDNCATNGQPTVTFNDAFAPGNCPQEMTITRTWTATYECSPSASCDQVITVVDTTPPVLTVPPDVRVACDVPNIPPFTGTATATDNCADPVVPTFVDSVVPGPEMSTIYTRTWTVTDGCNEVSDTQTITQFACQSDRGSGSEKGSAFVFSDVTLRWDAFGNNIQDVFIELTNDWITDARVKMYFVNGDAPLDAFPPPPGPALPERAHPGWNFVDQGIVLTKNQASYWSVLTGQPGPGNAPLVPFTVLDPSADPLMVGRPALDGTGDRVLRGYIVGWAVNAEGDLIELDHLTGQATVVNYRDGLAWQYDAWTFQSVGLFFQGEVIGPGGRLAFDGMQFARPYAELLLDFYASGANALSGGSPFQSITVDSALVLHPLSADLRQENHGPITTKATFVVWNENETQLTGLDRCITCWDKTLLSLYSDFANHFLVSNLQTDKGKARIDGVQSQLCTSNCCFARADHGGCESVDCQELVCWVDADCCTDGWDDDCVWIAVDLCGECDGVNDDAALLGVAVKFLHFGGIRTAAGAMNLVGMGTEDAAILYDVVGGPGNPPPGMTPEDDREIDRDGRFEIEEDDALDW